MRFMGIIFGVLFLFTAATVPVQAADQRDEAVKMVQSAVAFYKANGLEKSLDEFSKTNGAFNKGEIYIFIYDLSGNMLAHPNSKLIGQNMMDLPDASGKKYHRREIIATAIKDGKGWTDYKYQNPKSKEIEEKTTYYEKIDDIVICCGVYKK